MYLIHEGEVLLKEKYGSSARKRIYVKPPQQNDVVILDNTVPLDLNGWLYRVFLPQGYPDSVSRDYISYQIWDTAQAFCSTITGTLATQQVLRGVGVGDSSATPLAATITWVLKDGCGHLGRILFAFSHGTYLDAYSKKWRLYADIMNDAAMCIEIALPVFNNYTIVALCMSTALKAVVGVSGGATRIALTQHHAIRGNMADVAAKDSAQETAVNLVASLTAVVILSIIGNPVWLFLLLTVLHIAFNYLAVRSVCLRTLNEPRYLQIIKTYLHHEILGAPCEINRQEPIIIFQEGENSLDYRLCGFRIKLGCSIKRVTKRYSSSELLRRVIEVYMDDSYMLYPVIPFREMYVLVRDTATTEDILRAYFHAVLLSVVICAINNQNTVLYSSSHTTLRPFSQVCRTIQSVDWSRDPGEDANAQLADHYEPSLELLNYINTITRREWKRFSEALLKTGWVTNKHLLIMDEWRVSSYIKKPNEVHHLSDYFDKSTSIDQSFFLKSSLSDLANVLLQDDDKPPFISSIAQMTEGNKDEVDEIFTIEPDMHATSINLPKVEKTARFPSADSFKKPIQLPQNAMKLETKDFEPDPENNELSTDSKTSKGADVARSSSETNTETLEKAEGPSKTNNETEKVKDNNELWINELKMEESRRTPVDKTEDAKKIADESSANQLKKD